VTLSSSIGVVGTHLPAGKQREAIEELTTAFSGKYGYPPPQFAQDGYSAVKLLVAAIGAAGSTDKAKVRDALEGLRLLTPNGTYAYSATDHSGMKPEFISINTVTGGAFVPTDWAKSQLATLTGS
jgi:branched-chain amino acid transport system substrate-binding protein